jgi:hypothetical protein
MSLNIIGRSIEEATSAALDREDGWSSNGENNDGGNPITPVPLPTKIHNQPNDKDVKGMWRPETQKSGNSGYFQQSSWRGGSSRRGHPKTGLRNTGKGDEWGGMQS